MLLVLRKHLYNFRFNSNRIVFIQLHWDLELIRACLFGVFWSSPRKASYFGRSSRSTKTISNVRKLVQSGNDVVAKSRHWLFALLVIPGFCELVQSDPVNIWVYQYLSIQTIPNEALGQYSCVSHRRNAVYFHLQTIGS